MVVVPFIQLLRNLFSHLNAFLKHYGTLIEQFCNCQTFIDPMLKLNISFFIEISTLVVLGQMQLVGIADMFGEHLHLCRCRHKSPELRTPSAWAANSISVLNKLSHVFQTWIKLWFEKLLHVRNVYRQFCELTYISVE